MQSLVQSVIANAALGAIANEAGYAAHILLAALHIDLIKDLLANGLSLQAIRRAQAAHAWAVINYIWRR